MRWVNKKRGEGVFIMTCNQKKNRIFMKRHHVRRVSCLFLAAVMALMILPVTGWAAETNGELHCKHTHDTSCGYVAGTVGSPCLDVHTHDLSCGYAAEIEAILCTCVDTDGDGVVDHAENCSAVPAQSEQPCRYIHTHSDRCGYLPATEEVPCNHVHTNECYTPVPTEQTPEPVQCTCAAADGEAHQTTCPYYVAPECTCGAAEGELHSEDCPCYTAAECTCGAAEDAEHLETCPLYIPLLLMMSPMRATTFGAAATPPESTTDVTKISTNHYEITTRLYMDKAKATPNDVVLILDCSDTMIDGDHASNEPIDEAVQAAKTMVATLLGTGDNRVAVVCFANSATQLADFTDAAGKDALLTTLGGLDGSTIAGDDLGSGTNTQAGLHVARTTLGGARSGVSKTVVLLTDGKANDRYKLNHTYGDNLGYGNYNVSSSQLLEISSGRWVPYLCAFLWSPAAYAAEGKPITITLPPVSQKTIGSYVPSNQSFSFTLTAQDGAPMPDGSLDGGKTVTVTDQTEATFGTVVYSATGKCSYRVQQRVGTNSNYSYDRTVYTVSVLVDQFNDGVLHYTTWVSRPEAEGKQTAIVFENTYSSPGEPTDPPDRPAPPPDPDRPAPAPDPDQPAPPSGPDDSNKTDPPKTGDDFNFNVWLALLILSGIGMCYFGYRSWNRQGKNDPNRK